MKSLFLIILIILIPAVTLAQYQPAPQVQPPLRPNTNYLVTTTMGGGGQTYTNYLGSDGSHTHVIVSPGGSATITQHESADTELYRNLNQLRKTQGLDPVENPDDQD